MCIRDRGSKVGDREGRIRVAMHDLPLQTAQMYRDKMSGLNFVMTAQVRSQSEPVRTSKRDRRQDNSAHTAAARPAQPTKQQQISQAASTGDLSAALNNRSK